MSLLVPVIILTFLVVPVIGQLNETTSSCGLCRDGANVSHPEKIIPDAILRTFRGILPSETISCQVFDQFLASINDDEEECHRALLFLGHYCGCREEDRDNIFEPPCSLCTTNQTVLHPDKEINLFNFSTCSDLDEAVYQLLPDNSESCHDIRSIRGACGCESDEVVAPCTLCKDGSAISSPNRTIPFWISRFGVDMTCELFETSLLTVDENDEKCALSRGASSWCGCEPVNNHCEFCPGEDISAEFRDEELELLFKYRLYGFEPTCAFAKTLSFQTPSGSSKELCQQLQHNSVLCGCSDPISQQAEGAGQSRDEVGWILKISASLSICGALLVMVDIIRSTARSKRIYCRLMLAKMFFELVYAIGWFVGPWASPALDVDGAVWDANGDPSCTAQGFVLQLGQTSLLCNVGLLTYFLLVLNHGWKEKRLQRIQKLLILRPVILGFVLAFVAVPFYGWTPLICYIQPYPTKDRIVSISVLFFVPVGLSITVVTVLLLMISAKVLHPTTLTTLYSQSETLAELTQLVFWQSFWYSVASFITWPVLFYAFWRMALDGSLSYSISVAIAVLAPLQAFATAILYFRPRHSNWYHRVVEQNSLARASSLRSLSSHSGMSSLSLGTIVSGSTQRRQSFAASIRMSIASAVTAKMANRNSSKLPRLTKKAKGDQESDVLLRQACSSENRQPMGFAFDSVKSKAFRDAQSSGNLNSTGHDENGNSNYGSRPQISIDPFETGRERLQSHHQATFVSDSTGSGEFQTKMFDDNLQATTLMHTSHDQEENPNSNMCEQDQETANAQTTDMGSEEFCESPRGADIPTICRDDSLQGPLEHTSPNRKEHSNDSSRELDELRVDAGSVKSLSQRLQYSDGLNPPSLPRRSVVAKRKRSSLLQKEDCELQELAPLGPLHDEPNPTTGAGDVEISARLNGEIDEVYYVSLSARDSVSSEAKQTKDHKHTLDRPSLDRSSSVSGSMASENIETPVERGLYSPTQGSKITGASEMSLQLSNEPLYGMQPAPSSDLIPLNNGEEEESESFELSLGFLTDSSLEYSMNKKRENSSKDLSQAFRSVKLGLSVPGSFEDDSAGDEREFKSVRDKQRHKMLELLDPALMLAIDPEDGDSLADVESTRSNRWDQLRDLFRGVFG